MVTQMYALSSPWPAKAKGVRNGYVHGPSLAHVGFRGMSLTPIQESPLLDSVLAEEMQFEHNRLHHSHMFGGSSEMDQWLPPEVGQGDCNKSWKWNGSLPPHWLTTKARTDAAKQDVDLEAEACVQQTHSTSSLPVSTSPTPSAPIKVCEAEVHVVHAATFFTKDEPMSQRHKRSYACKLIFFAVVGFLVIAGIVLWIFSPAFT